MIKYLLSILIIFTPSVEGAELVYTTKISSVRMLCFPADVSTGSVIKILEHSVRQHPESLYALNGVLLPLPPYKMYPEQVRKGNVESLIFAMDSYGESEKAAAWVRSIAVNQVEVQVGEDTKLNGLLDVMMVLHKERVNFWLSADISPGSKIVLRKAE